MNIIYYIIWLIAFIGWCCCYKNEDYELRDSFYIIELIALFFIHST